MLNLKFELIPINPGEAKITVKLKDPNSPGSLDSNDQLKIERNGGGGSEWLDSTGKWIDHACTLNVKGSIASGQLTFLLGNDLVNALSRKIYLATLVRGSNEVVGSGTFSARNIQYRIAGSPAVKISNPDNQGSVTNDEVLSEKSPQEAPEQAVKEEPKDESAVKAKGTKKAVLLLTIGALCLALAAAVAVFFLFIKPSEPSVKTEVAKVETDKKKTAQSNTATADKSQSETDSRETTKKEDPQPESTKVENSKAEATKEKPVKVLSTREIVQQYFSKRDTRSGSSAVELAKKIEPKTSEDYEALFRLYYYAVGENNKDAYVPYAKFLDPSLPAFGTIKKSPVEAWDLYVKAGDNEAAANLKKWVEEQASRENSQAKIWLSKMK